MNIISFIESFISNYHTHISQHLDCIEFDTLYLTDEVKGLVKSGAILASHVPIVLTMRLDELTRRRNT